MSETRIVHKSYEKLKKVYGHLNLINHNVYRFNDDFQYWEYWSGYYGGWVKSNMSNSQRYLKVRYKDTWAEPYGDINL